MRRIQVDLSGVDATLDRSAARRLADVWDGPVQEFPSFGQEPPDPVVEPSPLWPRIRASLVLLAAIAGVMSFQLHDFGRHSEHAGMFRGSLRGAGAFARHGSAGDVQMKIQTTASVAAFVVAAASAQAQQAVQWRVEDGGNGHWYALGSPAANWHDAAAHAVQMGGHLATLPSADETAFAAGVAANENVAYIGAAQASGSAEPFGGWRWITGEPWSFESWHFNMDDAPCGSSNGDGEQQFLWMHNSVRQWDDVNDRDIPGCPLEQKRGIIEWSADCNNDGIVDYGQCRDGTLADYNGNNIPDCCEQGEPCVLGHYPVQWMVSEGGNGHWYAIVWSGLSEGDLGNWDRLDSLARGSGARLCSIASLNENHLVRSLVTAYRPINGFWCYLGATQVLGPRCSATSWEWVDGTPWVFTQWQPGQPDCLTGSGGAFDEPRMAIRSFTGEWGDWNGRELNNAVFEWSADCDSDGIVDYGQILRGERPDANTNGVPDGCECLADLNGDGVVQGADLGLMLAAWGSVPASVAADINRDGAVDGNDLGLMLAGWGPCGG